MKRCIRNGIHMYQKMVFREVNRRFMIANCFLRLRLCIDVKHLDNKTFSNFRNTFSSKKYLTFDPQN